MNDAKNEADSGASRSDAVLENLAWAAFSERFHAAQRKELEYFPGLRAAWEDWRDAWMAGADAGRDFLAEMDKRSNAEVSRGAQTTAKTDDA